MEGALERARRDLLDLTFRNKFLNFRVLKAQGVAVANDDAERVRTLLVDSSARITFVDADEARDAYDAWQRKRQRGLEAQQEARELLGTGEPLEGQPSPGAPEDSGDDASTSVNDEVDTDDLVHVAGAEIRRVLPDRVLIADHDGANLDKRLLNMARIARTMIEQRV